MQITTKTNHFGPVLLTLLLLDVVKKSAPSRLIWVGSPAEAFGSPDWSDLKCATFCTLEYMQTTPKVFFWMFGDRHYLVNLVWKLTLALTCTTAPR